VEKESEIVKYGREENVLAEETGNLMLKGNFATFPFFEQRDVSKGEMSDLVLIKLVNILCVLRRHALSTSCIAAP
jgi:hypothetical protein